MNSKIVKVITGLLSVFVILYVAAQAVDYFYSPYKAQTVFKSTVNNSIFTDALVLRDETVIDQNKQGVIRYLVQNGSKVAQKSVIAEKYKSESDMLFQKQIESISEEIEVLTQAQDKGSTAAATLDSLTTQINDSYLEMMDAMQEGVYDSLNDYKYKLQGLIAKKHIVIGKQQDYNQRISALKQQQKDLQGSISQKPSVIASPHSGYFAQYVDGMESKYSRAGAKEVTAEEIQSLVAQKSQTAASGQSDKIGKIISTFEWNMTAYVSPEDAAALKEGQKVSVAFPSFGEKQYPMVVESVELDNATQTNQVILSCNIMDNNVTKMRAEKAEIILSKVTGIQIPKTAIRYENDEMGVYEKTGRKLYFRKIDKIYENQEYVISKDHEEDDRKHVYVHNYDDVVIEGKGLYDEKPIG